VQTEGDGVMGIGSFGDEVFVVLNEATQVDVYDAATMSIQRRLPLPSSATGSYRGLAACPVNRCVYVSDFGSDVIHRVSVDSETPATFWSVARWPHGVSLTTSNNVLAACKAANTIQEYVFYNKGFAGPRDFTSV